MNVNKRIWKTGVLAVAVTAAFAILVFRAAEWSEGLNSEFVVLGQTSTGTSTGGTGTTGGTQITKVIPQIVAGTFDNVKYSTVIQVVNTNSSDLTVSGNFYKEDGTVASLAFTTNLTSVPSISNGVLSAVSLAANQVLVITSSATASQTVAWGKIVTSGTASVSTFLELRDSATSVLYSRVGVPASPADMASFVIPRVRNVAAGFDVGFALVNSGTTAATLSGTLKDAAGVTIKQKTILMERLSHQAVFTREFFELTSEPGGTNYHYVVFESTSSAFAAMALGIEGGSLTSFPVDKLR